MKFPISHHHRHIIPSLAYRTLSDFVVDIHVREVSENNVMLPELPYESLHYYGDINFVLDSISTYACIRIRAQDLLMCGANMTDIANTIRDMYNENQIVVRYEDVSPYELFISKQPEKEYHNLVLQFCGGSLTQEQIETIVYQLVDKIIITGIPNIKKSYVHDGMVELDGVNMTDLFVYPEIDFNQTYSNDIYAIYDALGIDAAREVIFFELQEVLRIGGKTVNQCHLSLMSDIMCFTGALRPMTRHGQDAELNGVLQRSTFETMLNTIVEGSVFAVDDPISDVSSSVATGKMSRMGTGAFDIMLDDDVNLWNSSQPPSRVPIGDDYESDDEDDAHDDVSTEYDPLSAYYHPEQYDPSSVSTSTYDPTSCNPVIFQML